jgi:SAM-dependent methyltransferase
MSLGAPDRVNDRRIDRHRARWHSKPSLRAVYRDYHLRLRKACVPGPTLEIGAGSGNLSEAFPEATSLDIQWAPWLTLVADAQALPFRSESFANIVMLDVFHHLPHPIPFLSEAMRVLRPGGRLIMIEPNISLVSWLFFKLLHEEPVKLRDDPFDPRPRSSPRPYDSNQALPYLVFLRGAARLKTDVPELKIVDIERFALWAYPLSGGFQSWNLLPAALASPLLRLEARLSPWLGALAGFRLMITAERIAPTSPAIPS